MRNSFTVWCISLLVVLVAMSSCKEQAFDKHYERPSWLKGNAWELLESTGTNTIFLEAIEKSGYKSLVQGKGIVTVMAPNDEAFGRYFQSEGISSLDQLTSAELKKLVGYHLVYYSYNKDQFSNFKPNGAASENLGEAGLYYKHRTYSRDTTSTRQDPTDGNKTKTLFHKERFIPILSSNIFQTKGIDAKYNYEYFYPGSEWTGDGGGFNVSNASVIDYSIPTDNGYAYHISEVLRPLETIYEELASQSEYSGFLQTYDRFIDFWYDNETSNEFAAIGDSLFLLKFNLGLPEIASEWSYNGEFGIPDYANFPDLTGVAYNVFAPNNTALNSFFDSYWGPYYNTIDDVQVLPIAYLLYNHVNRGSIVFPEEITQNKITTPFGNAITFDPAVDVLEKKMCVNGSYYGLESVIVPPMFSSVTGPAFRDPKYRMFLFMLDKTNQIGPLMSDALDYTLFLPSDDIVSDILFDDSFIYWSEGSPVIAGDEELQVDGADGGRVTMSSGSMRRFVESHIVNENVNINKPGVYRTRTPLTYIFVSGDSIATNQSFNRKWVVNTTKIDGPDGGEWSNGVAYDTDRPMLREGVTVKSQISSTQSLDNELNYIDEFATLLKNSGLLPANAELGFLLGDNFMLFAPSNDVVIAAKNNNEIPTGTAELAEYLKYYFVPLPINSLNDFAFEGFGIEGDFKTSQVKGGVNSLLTLSDNGTSLGLTDATGGNATVVGEFPSVYGDGAVYMIDNMLKSE